MPETHHILEDGTGTVGSRIARGLFSIGYEVTLTKFSASDKDVKTWEIKRLIRDFGHDRKIPVYLIGGHDAKERMLHFERCGIEVDGTTEDMEWNGFTHVINAAKEGKEEEDSKRYGMHGLHGRGVPVLWQAKAPPELAGPENNGAGGFLSAPNTQTVRNWECYAGKNAMNYSCNDHFMGIATGLVLQVFSPDEIRRIHAYLARRYADRLMDRGKAPRHGPVKEKSKADSGDYIMHHAAMYPELRGRLMIMRSKNPWEPFHFGTLTFIMNRDVNDDSLDKLREAFREYPRCVFLETAEFSAERVVDVCEHMNIPYEGDCMLPVYSIERPVPDTLVISGLNPQRSVVVPGAVDWVQIAKGKSWEEAFRNTNENMKWHGYAISELKAYLEHYIQ